jgi:multimeric flavodoxin WrbA
MQLTIFNGSPRGKGGNTTVILEHFLKGFMETPGNSCNITYLSKTKEPAKLGDAFFEAEAVLIAFPLYVDSMPARVKDFFEILEPLCSRGKNPAIMFLIQSGFPEAVHLRFLERYLEKLSRRLKCRYIGTIVKGGSEKGGFVSIRNMPNSRIFKTTLQRFYEIGRSFGATGALDKDILTQLALPERFSKTTSFMLKMFQKLGAFDSSWNKQLKANGAYEKRFDAPYKRMSR